MTHQEFLQSLVRQTGEKSTSEAIRVLLVLAGITRS
jgi:hypothetical protein